MTAGPARDPRPSGREAPAPQDQRPGATVAHRVARTRAGGLWVTVALSAVVLLLLLIFILENGQQVSISYFGAHGHLPLGIALLLAAVLGVLLVVVPGTGRILQLRVIAHRHRRLDATVAAVPTAPAAGSAFSDQGST